MRARFTRSTGDASTERRRDQFSYSNLPTTLAGFVVAGASALALKYSLEEKNAKGRFYARAKRTGTSAGTCLAAQSKTVRLG